MNQFPLRHQNHTLEYRSELFLRNHLPQEWIIDKPVDYGIDFKIDIVKARQVIGQNFSIQLKAHENLAKGKHITASLDRSTINLYLARLEPVLVICYIAEQNEAYYHWFTEGSVDLTKNTQSYSLKFNTANKLSTLDWNTISNKVNEIFSRRALLHTFPEFNFSEMGTEEKEAASHYIQQDYETACFLYKQLHKKRPRVYWLNSIAMCHYALYQYKDALTHVNRALEQADLDEIRLNKAAILAEYGMETSNKAMVLEASQLFRTAIDHQGDTRQHFNYANTLSWLGENELAKKHLEKALKLNPNYAEAWKNLGEIYSRLNNPSKEIQCYDNALAINPKLPQALMCKGMALIREYKKYSEGITYLNQAYAVDPDLFSKYSSGYFWFSYANFKTNNEAAALNYLKQGLDHNPGDPYLLNLKRDYYRENWQQSNELRSQAKDFMHYRLELTHQDAHALECLCRIYLNEGNKATAMETLRTYTVLFRNTPIPELTAEHFDIGPFLDSLYSYGHYCQFRQQNPIEKDLNTANAPSFFVEFSELVGLKLFHECHKYIQGHHRQKQFEKQLFVHQFEQASKYYPLTAPYFITASVTEKEKFSEQMCSAMVHIPIFAIREMARITGYLTIQYKLNQRKIDQAISDTKERSYHKKMTLECAQQIQNRFHFLPED